MSEYIFSVVICAVVTAFVCVLTPAESDYSRFVGFVASIVMTTVIISPLAEKGFIDFNPEAEVNIDGVYERDYRKIAAESLAASIVNTVKEEKWEICILNVKVVLDENEDFLVKKVVLFIEKNKTNMSTLENHLSQVYKCTIEIKEDNDE